MAVWACAGPSRTTTTDEAGRFLFSLVSLGTYDITVALPGFQSKRITGNLVEAQKTTVVSMQATRRGASRRRRPPAPRR